ncbi:MAG: MBL fold metallo-hydrolase [Burkholderiaceae bacterium]|jgi:hydroxyacylglutathione hydrolase
MINLDYTDGISAIDSEYCRAQMDAIHLVIEEDRAAIIDTGTNSSVPNVIGALAEKGLSRESVDFVILTHVHLDHAGGAGRLMQEFPKARLVVHPRGVRHMVDPAKLMAGTIEVYGKEAAERMYGTIVPVPAERIIEAHDTSSVLLVSRRMQFFDTPGHARHHICIRDDRTGHLFTGDMFGLSYRELDRGSEQFVFPATTPIQFDPAAFHSSIHRLCALEPGALYVTHYGRVNEPLRLAPDLLRLVDAHAHIARAAAGLGPTPERLDRIRQGVTELVVAESQHKGWGLQGAPLLELMHMDIELNSAGLAAWLDSGR